MNVFKRLKLIDQVNLAATEAMTSPEASVVDAEFQFYDQINDAMKVRGIDRKTLADNMGVSDNHLCELFQGSETTIRTMVAIASGMDCEIRINVVKNNKKGTK